MTSADNGATVMLAAGQTLTVDLATGAFAWDRPQLRGSALRQESVTGGYPDSGPMRAVYLAVGSGTATVSAVSDAPCLHERPRCSIPQRLWTVRVVVRDHPAAQR